jgi:hypothetical protein
MLRRGLLSFVGAVGLIAGLISSGVAVQADTAAPTLDALIATWSGSTQNVCYSNSGSAQLVLGICTINQGASPQANVAVCVQNNATAEDCEINQTNALYDNRALVLQNYFQSGSPSESATQTVHITQNNVAFRNDAWVGQNVYQTTGSAGAQTQSAQQFDGITQNAATGGQKVIMGQLSSQRANSNAAVSQQQYSDQDAHDIGGHIIQTSSGLSEILVGEAQIQTATGLGFQNQIVDPRCCSNQTGNILDTFKIFQFVYQKNNAAADDPQDATSVAECHTTGSCNSFQTTTNNTTTTTNTCSGKNCFAVVHCGSAVVGGCTQTAVQCTSECFVNPPPCPSFVPGCNLGLAPTTSFANRGLAIVLGPSRAKPLSRSASSVALLT